STPSSPLPTPPTSTSSRGMTARTRSPPHSRSTTTTSPATKNLPVDIRFMFAYKGPHAHAPDHGTDVDEATEGARRLPRRLHHQARLRADARGNRRALRLELAR